jgi:hypothetical protein
VKNWKKLSGPKGSNPGGVYETPDGTRYYVKQSQSADHARNEVLAARLYAAVGVPTPELELIDTAAGLGTASPLITDAKPDLHARLADRSYLDQLSRGYAADAWLANWDVVGLIYDNVVSDSSGRPIRIDLGGSLLYRAMGSPKGSMFGDEVNEWDSLRNSELNPQSSRVFSKLSLSQLVSSIDPVAQLTGIPEIVAGVGFSSSLTSRITDTLLARQQNLARLR